MINNILINLLVNNINLLSDICSITECDDKIKILNDKINEIYDNRYKDFFYLEQNIFYLKNPFTVTYKEENEYIEKFHYNFYLISNIVSQERTLCILNYIAALNKECNTIESPLIKITSKKVYKWSDIDKKNWDEQIVEKVLLCDENITMVDLHIVLYNNNIREGYHAGLLIINSKFKTIYRFEPHGKTNMYNHNMMDEFIKNMCKRKLNDYQYNKIENMCIRIPYGPQNITGDSLCNIWTMFFASLQLVNSNTKPSKIYRLLSMKDYNKYERSKNIYIALTTYLNKFIIYCVKILEKLELLNLFLHLELVNIIDHYNMYIIDEYIHLFGEDPKYTFKKFCMRNINPKKYSKEKINKIIVILKKIIRNGGKLYLDDFKKDKILYEHYKTLVKMTGIEPKYE